MDTKTDNAPMRAQLLHLSGPLRGRTVTYPDEELLIGTGPPAQLDYGGTQGVVERHASVSFQEDACAFHLRALDGPVFVNGQEIREVILEPEDLVEIGRGGPKFRFFVHCAPGRVCKPMRRMLTDARDVGARSGLRALTASFRRDLVLHSSPQLRIGLPLLIAALIILLSYLGGWMGGRQGGRKQAEQVSRSAAEDAAARRRKENAELEERLRSWMRQRWTELRTEFDGLKKQSEERFKGLVSRTEMTRLRARLDQSESVVKQLVRENAELQKVLDVYSRSVCLLHGKYGFKATRDGKTEWLEQRDGEPASIEYVGSGFMVSESGDVLTNRHVAQPWWRNSSVSPLLKKGLEPAFLSLTATFPGRAPIKADTSSIRFSQDADVALLKVPVKDVLPLPLRKGPVVDVRGKRVILLGYPTGIGALMARLEPDEVKAVLEAGKDDLGTIIAELARRGAVNPVITQGALNQVTDKRLVYDADTTSGGSGGPVFGPDGRVIGINFAITRDFGGSNFGVPIRFGRALLKP